MPSRGSVVKRGNGYTVVIELDRDPVTGKRQQRWHSGYRTKKDADRALIELTASVQTSTYIEPSRQSFAQFLTEWLATIEPTVRPATLHSYQRNIRVHVIPRLGAVQLRRIDGGMLNGLYATLLTEGKQRGGGLAPRTVAYVHTIVHRALRDAVRWGRLARNPADAADPPRKGAASRPAMTTWSAGEVRTFLDHVADHRLHGAFVLLASTGMRRGEVLGLRWSDVDLDGGRLSVVQTVIAVNHEIRVGAPKTARGRRSVALDPWTVSAVRDHRRRQLEERLLMGAGFTDHGLVFCRPDGGPLHPERFSRTFDRETAKTTLQRIRLHDLRHTWATLALATGRVHPKVVQERLGHSSIGITLDTYSHVVEGLHGDAAALVAGLFASPSVSTRLAEAGAERGD